MSSRSKLDSVPKSTLVSKKVSVPASFIEDIPPPRTWALPESPKFLDFVTNVIGPEARALEGQSILKMHQLLVARYLRDGSPYRGLYLFHTMGVGKTCSSIAILSGVRTKKKTWVLLPASLKGNYLSEYEKCGSQEYRSETNHWLKDDKGKWSSVAGKESNFDSLDKASQDEVRKTMTKTISRDINFLSFNGVSRTSLTKLSAEGNPFDDSIICIDEVHQFTRSLAIYDEHSQKSASRILYDMLYSAKNARIVMLSGTPLINLPIEIAYIVNLLKGPNVEHTIRWTKPITAPEIRDAKQSLMDSPHVLTAHVDASGAKVQMVPRGFVVADRDEWTVRHDESLSAKAVGMLQKTVQKYAGKLPDIVSEYYEPLPTMPQGEFNRLFVSPNTENIIKKTLLMRRMRGCISYFSARDNSLYPTAVEHLIKVPMSDEVYTEYSGARAAERKLEEKRTTNVDAPSVHRTYSRAAGNFVFPTSQGIKKWYKSSVRSILKLEQEALGGSKTSQKEVDRMYERVAKESLQKLKDHPLWKDDNLLKMHSPKYAAIYDSIKTRPGCAFVYSNFRSLEGVGLLGHLLETRGYGRVEVSKDTNHEYRLNIHGNTDSSANRYMMPVFNTPEGSMMLQIFNGEWDELPRSLLKDVREKLGVPAKGVQPNLRGDAVKVMMLSQSGSAGINLRNVRTGHIMEPHWNSTLLDQVSGRAVRMKSHINLPENERTVDIFTYVSTFSDHQRALPDFKVMQSYDKGQTSDEHLLAISKNKEIVLGQLKELMRSVSIDCKVHASVHGNKTCYSQPSIFGKELAMAPPDVHDDVEDPTKILVAKKYLVPGPDGSKVSVIIHDAQVYLEKDWAKISASSKNMPTPVGIVKLSDTGRETLEWNSAEKSVKSKKSTKSKKN